MHWRSLRVRRYVPSKKPLARYQITNILTEMHPLATLFTTIITGLRAAIGMHAHRHPGHALLINLAWAYLGRTTNRMNRLFACWQAGTLPAPRPAHPTSARARKPATTLRFPSAKTWLVGTEKN